MDVIVRREEAWYVAGAARSSDREQQARTHDFVKLVTPWRSQFAEKKGLGLCCNLRERRDRLYLEIVEVILSRV